MSRNVYFGRFFKGVVEGDCCVLYLSFSDVNTLYDGVILSSDFLLGLLSEGVSWLVFHFDLVNCHSIYRVECGKFLFGGVSLGVNVVCPFSDMFCGVGV